MVNATKQAEPRNHPRHGWGLPVMSRFCYIDRPAMPRNAEDLRTLEASRQGETVAALARQRAVTERTVWRDMGALQGSRRVNSLSRWSMT